MIFEQTEDSDFVTRCLTHPSFIRMGCDDSFIGINPSIFFIQKNDNFWLKTGDYGVLIGEPRNLVTYEVHVALLPNARGQAVDICVGAMRWMFSNTKAQRLNASIPEYNKLALRLASKVGMELIGINKKSFLKDGELFNQHLYGISKGE